MTKYVMVAVILCSTFRSYSAGDATPLYAGTAKVDITPREKFLVPHGGCAFRLPDEADRDKTPPEKVFDPIFARVLVLKNEKTSLAIVSLDLCLFASAKVVAEAKAKWNVDHVILSSSHTHSSMVPRGLCPTPKGWEAWENITEEASLLLDWPGFSEDPWYAETESKIVAAIGEAAKNMFPARIGAVKAPYESAYLGHNRRFVGPNGNVTMMWDNPDRIPTEPRDSTVGVIRVEDEAGKPRAFLVHYACHPVILMNSGYLSCDFPGPMADHIEQELGEDCLAMFLQGACGDLDPYECGLRGEYGRNFAQQSGIALAKAALKAADSMKPTPDETNTSIEIEESMVTLPYWKKNKTTEACVMTVVIDNKFAFVTIPGEPFVRLQLHLVEKSPLADTFLLGFAYCGAGSPWLRYIPDAQSASEGGFGASTQWYTFIAPNAGEMMVDQGVASIKKLMNR